MFSSIFIKTRDWYLPYDSIRKQSSKLMHELKSIWECKWECIRQKIHCFNILFSNKPVSAGTIIQPLSDWKVIFVNTCRIYVLLSIPQSSQFRCSNIRKGESYLTLYSIKCYQIEQGREVRWPLRPRDAFLRWSIELGLG